MKRLALLIYVFLLFLSGCTSKTVPLPDLGDASTRWKAFLQHSESISYDVLSCSLRFGPVNDTNRVTCMIWSGVPGGETSPAGMASLVDRSIRVEISAGLGTSVGRMLFAGNDMLLLLPRDKRAFVGTASQDNLRRLLGMPLPMTMQALNDFLAGRLTVALDSPRPEGYENLDDGNVRYVCRTADGSRCEVVLDRNDLPVRLSSPGKWTMDIAYDSQGFPSKLSGRMNSVEGEQRLVLQVKERRPNEGSSALSLAMPIPAGFTVTVLD